MKTRTYKKPLGRSIALGCILFTVILCLALSVLNYFIQKNALYKRYQTTITDILHYVDRHIDDEDLKRCIDLGEESETYKETLLFMDGIMNDFSIHYLYVVKPLVETEKVMSVMSAEDDYNRYIDTEGNLYLGWISDDEYDAETVQELYDIMHQDETVFFVEATEWSTDYTGAVPLKGDDGESYAILAVDVDITTLSSELWEQVILNNAVVILLGFLFTILFLLWSKKNISEPVGLLEQGAVEYANKSRGQRNVEALKFQAPDIHTDNEVESLSRAITPMTESMQEYLSEILSAEEKTRDMKELADAMSELAIVDSLTGIRNKTAYTKEAEKLEKELMEHENLKFGMAMIDMNFLKVVNDTYGHEKGDEALRTLTRVICTVFSHSPVFRIGGDEFVVILRGQDYDNIKELKAEFMEMTSWELDKEPWKKVSASIGIAFYDADTDGTVEDVLHRADALMYAMKKEMGAIRLD